MLDAWAMPRGPTSPVVSAPRRMSGPVRGNRDGDSFADGMLPA